MDTDKLAKVNAVNKTYAKRLIDFAKEKGIQLLFVKTPDTRWNTKQYNYIKKLAEENDIEYLDFNRKELRKEIGLDYATDAADGVHLNLNGATKVSKYLGTYLAENYDLTDFRESDNPVKKAYESGMDSYKASGKASALAMVTDFNTYLESVNDEDFSVIIMAGSEAGKIKFSENQRKLLMELGADESLFQESEYGKSIIFVKDSDVVVNKVTLQDEDYTKSAFNSGTLNNKTDYSISTGVKECSVRFNDSAFERIVPSGFNIIIYNKVLNNIADAIYLNADDSNLTLHRLW